MNEPILVIDVYRDEFEAWVRKNWDRKFHNFSVMDDNKYFYGAMQDAFDVWLGSKGMEYV